jgi:hypothetical protein
MIVIAWMLYTRGHDPDNCNRLGIEDDHPANDIGIGIEACAPNPVAQDGQAAVFRQFIAGGELAATSRCEAEHAEVAGGNAERMQHQRLTRTR